MNYIDIDKDLIPYSFEMSLNNKTYQFTINYNNTHDFFTVDLHRNDEVLVNGEKIVYEKPLFATTQYKDIPDISILPYDLSGEVDRITFKNFNEKVFLFLVGDEDVD